MKKKFTLKISAKIAIGFSALTLALILNALLVNSFVKKSRKVNFNIQTVYHPSEQLLTKLRDQINSTGLLMKNWVFVDKIPNTPDKNRLKKIHEEDYIKIKHDLLVVSEDWDSTDQKGLKQICNLTDSLYAKQIQITNQLASPKDYNNHALMASAIQEISENNQLTTNNKQVVSLVDQLIKHQQSQIQEARNTIDSSFIKLSHFITFACIILIVLSLMIAFVSVRSLVISIEHIKEVIHSMSKGLLPNEKIKERNDEIGDMSKALNELVSGLRSLSEFALEIGRGNYDSKFKPLSDKDVLGNSLLRMRDDLNAAAEEEAKRKLEDEHRNWATSGVAKFSDIMRQDNDKFDILSYNIISNLVKYLDANQGGIFVINDNDKYDIFIELISCYAYNRRKFLEKRIEMNEGLAGRCILEKETIYLTDIPESYTKINSGLGDANPRCLLLVPLMMNDQVFGVIELASFNELEPYQIEFVEKTAEIIAATLSSVKINTHTTKLLEQSRIQTEELASQEEEMRQNVEELRATQEQSDRKEQELLRTIEELRSQQQTK